MALKEHGLDLAVWAPPEFVSNGSNGMLSWVGPVLRSPAGVHFSLAARATGAAVPSLQRYEVGATACVNGSATRVGWASSSSDDHATTTFSLPDLDPSTTPLDIEMTIDDITTQGAWTVRWSLPGDAVHAPAIASGGRLAMLTDPAFVWSGDVMRTWTSPVTLDPEGIEFSYTAMVFDDGAPSMWDYEVDAVLRSSFGTLELAAGGGTSAKRMTKVFHAAVPDDVAKLPWDFELTIRDHAAGLSWSEEFSWHWGGA
ncbi:hypothetical protein ACFYTQ_30695 [Nocardia sp. NPDC004068]|uniref:hypothetical protein n=1 Tax=Nocardia sp. NPDC004068 TaxID=3364303 RepID=UPI0036D1373D